MIESLILYIIRQILRIMRKLKFPKMLCQFLNNLRHKYIIKKLMPYFIKASKQTKNIVDNKSKGHSNDIIWMFWWQGLSNMPPIVKACIQSIKRNYDPDKVILINKYNIKSYVTLPNYMWDKLYSNDISLAHFSDIVRFRLLQKYGGLWIDSTVYCTSKINNKKFDKFYTAGGYDNSYKYYVSAKWTSFLIGGSSHNELFVFMSKFYNLYWYHKKRALEYFILDYALYYAYLKDIGGFKAYVNNIAYKNNPHLPDLMKLLNKPFDIDMFNKITNDSNLFKLTYKKHFKKHTKSFYYMIIHDLI